MSLPRRWSVGLLMLCALLVSTSVAQAARSVDLSYPTEGLTFGNSMSVIGYVEPGATLLVKIDGSTVQQETVPSNTFFAFSVDTSALAPGEHTLLIHQDADEATPDQSVSFTKEAAPPDPPTLTSPQDGGNSTKGLYLESFDEPTIEDSTLAGTGTIPEIRVSGTVNLPIAGIDVNLKYGPSSNDLLDHVEVTGTRGTGMAIKARNDGTYAAHPASLDGLTLLQSTASGRTTANSAAPGYGVMLGNSLTDVQLRGNRIVGNAAGGLLSYVDTVGVDVADNWWGCNTGPNTTGCDTATPVTVPIDMSTWIVLAVTAQFPYIQPGGEATTITASLDTNNLGDNVQGAAGAVDFTTNRGTISPSHGEICPCGGPAEATLTSGTSTGRATVDNAVVTAEVRIGQGHAGGAPSLLDFGDVVVRASATRQLTVSNTGSAPLAVSGVTPYGAGKPFFSVGSDGCTGTTLTPGAQCVVDIDFTPLLAGPLSTAKIRVSTDFNTLVVPITATATVPLPVADPAALVFDPTLIHTISTTDLRIANNGDGALVVTDFTPYGANAGAFHVDPGTCADRSVGPGDDCVAHVAFSPTSRGVFSTTKLRVSTNGRTLALPMTATATAPSPVADPTALDFGSVPVHTTSTLDLTVRNDGDGPLDVSGLTLYGAGAGALHTDVGSCAAPVAPGDRCTGRVSFAPLQRGTVTTAKLRVGTNGRTLAIPMTATATVWCVSDSLPARAAPSDASTRELTQRQGR